MLQSIAHLGRLLKVPYTALAASWNESCIPRFIEQGFNQGLLVVNIFIADSLLNQLAI